MRVAGSTTVSVSTGPATFWGASSDGRYAFYIEEGKLWRFDAEPGADPEHELLAGAGVQGVTAISDDGAYVYFVTGAALTADAENRTCRSAQDDFIVRLNEVLEKGTFTEQEIEELSRLQEEEQEEGVLGILPHGRGCNLYVRNGATTRLITTLAGEDNQFIRVDNTGVQIRLGDWQGESRARTAQVAAGGRELVFESTQRLTGYDNSSVTTHDPYLGIEVFVYEVESGHISCASCDPNGVMRRPDQLPAGQAYLPVSDNPASMRRWMSADGSRVFFDSSDPLVPQDTNGAQDVYEWERAGTEECPVGKNGGCVSLLSGGDSNDHSFFVDASEDGKDVFFTHRGQLAGIGAPDGHTALFDARAGGGVPVSSIACTGTGCQGVPPAPPAFASPPSATFAGGGNYLPGHNVAKKQPSLAELLAKALRACKQKKQKRKRAACERQARKRYLHGTGKAGRHKVARRTKRGRK
jgi:hypothetical protein